MFAVSEHLKELWLAFNYINHSLKKAPGCVELVEQCRGMRCPN
jgi:hypothetical protein